MPICLIINRKSNSKKCTPECSTSPSQAKARCRRSPRRDMRCSPGPRSILPRYCRNHTKNSCTKNRGAASHLHRRAASESPCPSRASPWVPILAAGTSRVLYLSFTRTASPALPQVLTPSREKPKKLQKSSMSIIRCSGSASCRFWWKLRIRLLSRSG